MRGGARPNSGPKKRATAPAVGDKSAAARIIDALNHPAKSDDSYEIKQFRKIDDAGASSSESLRKWLYDKRDGKPVQTVNHLHDKPLEMNVTLSIAEVVRKVRQRKAEYERNR